MKSGSFDAVLTSVAAPGTADVAFTVTHTLGGDTRAAIPRGWIVVRRNKAARLYESGTAWTTTTAYFKSDTALARFTVLFFA